MNPPRFIVRIAARPAAWFASPETRADLRALAPPLLAALLVRLWGIRWGMPGAAGDMTAIHTAWGFWNWGEPGGLSFNPHDFGWPSLLFYLTFLAQVLLYAGGRLTGRFRDAGDFRVVYETDPTAFVMAGRAISLLADLGCILATWMLARRLFGRTAASAAALILAFDVQHVAWAQNSGPEVWVALFTMLASGALLDIARGGGRTLRPYLWFGLWTGLGTAAKYTPALLFLSLPLAWAHSPRRAAAARGLLLAPASAAAAFFLASPYVLLSARESLFYSASQLNRLARVSHFGQADAAPAWLYYLRDALPETLGPVLLLLGAAGMAFFAARRATRRDAILFLFPVVYFALMGAASSHYAHYMIPVTPFLAVAAAGLLWTVAALAARAAGAPPSGLPAAANGRARRASLAPWVLLLAGAAFPLTGLAARHERLSRPDTRELARAWVERQVPRGALVLSEFGGPELLNSDRLRSIRTSPEWREVAPRLLPLLAARPDYPLLHLPLFAQEPEESAPFYELALFRGFDVFITSSEVSDRYRREMQRFAKQVAFYRWVGGLAPPLAAFRPDAGQGPAIQVYSLQGVFERYQEAGGTTPRAAWTDVRLYGKRRPERAAEFARRMGSAYEACGLDEEAVLAFAVASELTPRDADVHHALAAALGRLGRMEEARRMYERALSVNPEHRGSLNNLGGLELRAGNVDKARRLLEHALAVDPAFPDAHANLGWLLLVEDHDSAGAARRFEEALRLAPAHPQAERLRAALEELRRGAESRQGTAGASD